MTNTTRTRPIRFHLHLTEAEHAMLVALAEGRGLTITQLLRMLIHEAAAKRQ